MSLTPTLITMFKDPLLQDRYLGHLNRLIELSEKEIERTRNDSSFHETAWHYHEKFSRSKEVFFNRYNRDLTTAFKKFQDLGYLEIITCGATHGFLPLISRTTNAVRAQIYTATRQYEKTFEREPIGIWLPECGYMSGIDNILKEAGIRYFLTDTHGILHASPRPKYGVFAPIYCPTGVAAFGRDRESSKQVWSSVEGYPGDYRYREYYRDIGFDLDQDYITPYISPDGMRVNTGIKYYRITGDTDHKEPYVRSWALDAASDHAGNFMFNRQRQAEHLHDFLGRKPIIVAPYDAELFGHWWYEGPKFLDFLIRKIAFDQDTIKLVTPSDYLRSYPVNQISTPSMSSWGWKGYSETWLSGANHWIYRHIHKATLKMGEFANKYRGCNGLIERSLNQAVRELFLAQSSDWAFIMHTGTMVEYAEKRTKDHILNFLKIHDDLLKNKIDEGWLHNLEKKNNIFPEADYKLFCDN